MDSYVRRVRWEAREYAIQLKLLEAEVYQKSKQKKGEKQQDEAPKRNGVLSAEDFLALSS